MIYKPQETLGLRNFLWGGFIKALEALAADFNAGTNKPWTYYLGVGIGGACAATGVPGAAATAYVLAAALDVWIFKSPNGSIVKFYVDGLLKATIDASKATDEWAKITIDTDAGKMVRVDIVNGEPGVLNVGGISWMAISQLESPGMIVMYEEFPVSIVQGSLSITDADANTRTVPIYATLGSLTIAQITAWMQRYATRVNPLVEGIISAINLTIAVDLPGGLRTTPEAGSNVQEGALFSWVATGTTYKHGQWLPAFSQEKFTGKEVTLSDADVADFLTFMGDGESLSGATIQSTDKYENDLVDIHSAVKRFRK